jgi:glycosyltransferase involved in cell wall biosynthesis
MITSSKKNIKMKILYFGTYEKDYPRNRVVIKGLKKNNIRVKECHVPFWENVEDKTGKLNKGYFLIKLHIAHLKLFFKHFKHRDCNIVIIGYIGQLDMFLARICFPRKKIIFNPMISLYDTLVLDRKIIRKGSFLSKIIRFFDKKSCDLADIICLDTKEHIKYFENEFGIKRKKLKRLFIGAEEEIFYPRKETKKRHTKVLFYGKFTPLHGTSYIIKAAKLLEKKNKYIKFEIIGTGQTHKKDIQLAKKLNVKNIKFIDWVPYRKLPLHIADADICLGGHFGSGEKARRVVPNKVFQMIAMKKPVIVSDSGASVEAGFIDRRNALFCKMQDEKAIADSILKLAKNKRLRDNIAKKSFNLFNEKYSTKAIGKDFLNIIQY